MSHTVELIAVGTELLLGSIANTDGQLLSRELSALGLNVHYHTVVGDNPQRLREVVETAGRRADILITTGGLGPTCDDLTKHVLAAAFGRQLVPHPESAQRIRAYFQRAGKVMTDNNLRQALLPQDCVVFPNDWGTAPGCAFHAGNCHVLMLPGPPGECLPMFRAHAAPYLQALSEGVILSRTLRVFGSTESGVEELLRREMNELTNPTLAPYAKVGEVELRITAKADSREEALARMVPVEARVRQVLGDLVYGVGETSLEEVAFGLLRDQGLTLGCAESCTGGLVAKRFTDLPGASQVFRGGVVSYCDGVKEGLLGVPQAILEQYSAVSPQAAAAMAEGAARALGCRVAVSTTGVAGPGPDAQGRPAGLVYVGLWMDGESRVRSLRLTGGRERVRTVAASHAFDMVRRKLQGLPEGRWTDN